MIYFLFYICKQARDSSCVALHSLLGVWDHSEILEILSILEESSISNLSEYMQKAATALKIWAYSESCESDYRCGLCLHFKCLQPFQCFSVWFWQKIFEWSTKLCHQIPTHSFVLARFGSKETFMSISGSLLEGTRGEKKINGFNFILANQIPIKLKEKLKPGQCEH